MSKGQDVMQDMDMIKLAHVNLKVLGKAKCKVLHSRQMPAEMRDEGIERCSMKKD